MAGKVVFCTFLITSLWPLIWCQCDVTKCKLPDCFCPSNKGPSSVPEKETPQMVVFTFDDAINGNNYKYYKRLFAPERKNPNTCPITATFFVSHKWTDYNMLHELYLKGHEMASHSITHRLPREWWSVTANYDDWVYEIEGQRNHLSKKGYIPIRQLKGMRVPFLQLGRDIQFKMLQDHKYLYDSSFMVGPYSENDWRMPIWPFTLDFPPKNDHCDSQYCPKKSHPGLWEFPLNRWIGLDGKACPMVDACKKPTTKEEALRYIWRNFERHYKSHRTPFGINMHAIWFDQKVNFEGMDLFVQQVLKKKDVYIVTVDQMIQWMKRPTSLKNLHTFQPWMTSCREYLAVRPVLKKKSSGGGVDAAADGPGGRKTSWRFGRGRGGYRGYRPGRSWLTGATCNIQPSSTVCASFFIIYLVWLFT